MKSIELRQRRAGLIERAGAILKKAEDEKRNLRESEQKEFDGLHEQAEQLRTRIEAIELQEQHERDLAKPIDDRPTWRTSADGNSKAQLLGVTERGERVRLYRPNEPMAEPTSDRDEARATLGGIVRGLTTNNWSGYESERRALSSGSGGLGGYLLPSPVSQRVIDNVRNQTRVIQAGALTFPIEGNSMRVVRIIADPTAYWRHENQPLTASDMTFDALTFTPRVVGALVSMPLELVEDAPNVGQIVEDSLSAALALEQDRVALSGSGSESEPRGIANTSGVNTLTSVGTPTNYDDYSQAAEEIRVDNLEPSAIIIAPRDLGLLDRLKDSQNQPLNPPESWRSLTKFSSNQCRTALGAGSDESEAVVGGFESVWFGIRRQVTIEATRSGSADGTNEAFRNLQVLIRAWMRVDVGVVRPKHLCVMSGVTTS